MEFEKYGVRIKGGGRAISNQHFGELYQKESGRIKEDTYIFCSICFGEKKITKYSKTTSSTSLNAHLELVHKISISISTKNQQTLTAMLKAGGSPISTKTHQAKTKYHIGRQICIWMIMDNIPFSAVDSPHFKKLLDNCIKSDDSEVIGIVEDDSDADEEGQSSPYSQPQSDPEPDDVFDNVLSPNANPKKYHTLKISVSTRWNSILRMFQSFMEHKDIHIDGLKNLEKYELLPKKHDIEIITEAMNLLKIFADATDLIEGSQYPTVNLALLVYTDIKKRLQQAPPSKMKTLLLQNLDKRFKITDLMLWGAILDPSIQHLSIIEEILDKKKTTRLAFLQSCTLLQSPEFNEPLDSQNSDTSELEPGPSVSKRQRLVQEYTSIQRIAIRSVDEDLERFRRVKENVPDTLDWWRTHGNEFPFLRKYAVAVLAIPITSAQSERNFSAAGNVCSSKRTNLSPLNVEKILFIKLNYQSLFGEYKKKLNDK
ncbi:hypothetical protein DMENIID0001_041920 [Sergentomyia squamirostris]